MEKENTESDFSVLNLLQSTYLSSPDYSPDGNYVYIHNYRQRHLECYDILNNCDYSKRLIVCDSWLQNTIVDAQNRILQWNNSKLNFFDNKFNIVFQLKQPNSSDTRNGIYKIKNSNYTLWNCKDYFQVILKAHYKDPFKIHFDLYLSRKVKAFESISGNNIYFYEVQCSGSIIRVSNALSRRLVGQFRVFSNVESEQPFQVVCKSIEVNNSGTELYIVYHHAEKIKQQDVKLRDYYISRFDLYNLSHKGGRIIEGMQFIDLSQEVSGVLKQSQVSDLIYWSQDGEQLFILEGKESLNFKTRCVVGLPFSRISRVVPCPTREEVILYSTMGSRNACIVGLKNSRVYQIYDPTYDHKTPASHEYQEYDFDQSNK